MTVICFVLTKKGSIEITETSVVTREQQCLYRDIDTDIETTFNQGLIEKHIF